MHELFFSTIFKVSGVLLDSSFILNAIRGVEKACIETLCSAIAANKFIKYVDGTFNHWLQGVINVDVSDVRVTFVLQHLHRRQVYRDTLYAAWLVLPTSVVPIPVPAKVHQLQGWYKIQQLV